MCVSIPGKGSALILSPYLKHIFQWLHFQWEICCPPYLCSVDNIISTFNDSSSAFCFIICFIQLSYASLSLDIVFMMCFSVVGVGEYLWTAGVRVYWIDLKYVHIRLPKVVPVLNYGSFFCPHSNLAVFSSVVPQWLSFPPYIFLWCYVLNLEPATYSASDFLLIYLSIHCIFHDTKRIQILVLRFHF